MIGHDLTAAAGRAYTARYRALVPQSTHRPELVGIPYSQTIGSVLPVLAVKEAAYKHG